MKNRISRTLVAVYCGVTGLGAVVWMILAAESLTPAVLMSVSALGVVTIVAGVLLLTTNDVGYWLVVVVLLLQVPVLSLGGFRYQLLIGPSLAVRAWPPIGVTFGYAYGLHLYWSSTNVQTFVGFNVIPWGVMMGLVGQQLGRLQSNGET